MELYRQDNNYLLEQYDVDIVKGLSKNQVLANRKNYGENKLPEEKEDGYIKVFFKVLKSPL